MSGIFSRTTRVAVAACGSPTMACLGQACRCGNSFTKSFSVLWRIVSFHEENSKKLVDSQFEIHTLRPPTTALPKWMPASGALFDSKRKVKTFRKRVLTGAKGDSSVAALLTKVSNPERVFDR